jgi:hypothetical protein
MNATYRAYLDLAAAMSIIGSSVVVGKIVVTDFPIFMALLIRSRSRGAGAGGRARPARRAARRRAPSSRWKRIITEHARMSSGRSLT